MDVKLLTNTEALKAMEFNAAFAALTCHANTDKDFVPSEVLQRIIKRGHESVLEHINLTYSVKGISRALLQELARHRHISLSVESTRHTLKKKMADEKTIETLLHEAHEILPAATLLNFSNLFRSFGIDINGDDNDIVGDFALFTLTAIEYITKQNKRVDPDDNTPMINDELKYYLPEFWPTNLVLTSNIRELRHILDLRTAPAALKEFRTLARELFNVVPDEFKYLLQDCVHEEVANG